MEDRSIDYVITGVSYTTSDKGTSIVLCTRDPKGRRVIFTRPYIPYFYYLQSQERLFKELLRRYKTLRGLIIKEERYFYSTTGRQLIKVYVKYPWEVKAFSKKVEMFNKIFSNKIRLYEANVLFSYRYLIDHNIYTTVDKGLNPINYREVLSTKISFFNSYGRHRLMFLDIEVEGDEEWIEGSYRYPLIIIGLFDSYSNTYYQLYVGSEYKYKGEVPIVLQQYDNEEELLLGFKKLYTSISPDVIVTFSPFDIKYLYNRLKKYKIDPGFLSPIRKVTQGPHIHCVDILDFAELYRRVFEEPLWNTLDYIAKKELSYGKIELPGPIHEVWKNDPILVLKYNLRDVKLLKDLEDKLKLIEGYIIPIWKITGLKFSDCLTPYKIGDILYLRRAYQNNKVWRSRSWIRGTTYKGALVVAKPGIYENVAVLDWSELYPSLMETFHISWDTIGFAGGPKHVRIEGGLYFSLEQPGETVLLMQPLREERRKIKTKLKGPSLSKEEKNKYRMLSSAYKSIINALYGLYGFSGGKKGFGSRVYEPAIASAITSMGRIVFKETMNYCTSIGKKVVYGDTDSIFIVLTSDQLEEEAKELASKITSHIAEFIKERYKVRSTLKLSLEYIFRRVVILTKKRYAGITLEGEEVIKGLEIVRRNTSPITIEAEKKILEILLKGGSIQDVIKYRDKIYKEVSSGKRSLLEIALRPRCSKEKYDTLTSNYKARIIGEHYLKKKISPKKRFYKLYLLETLKIKKEVEIRGQKIIKNIPVNVIALPKIEDFPNNLQVDFKKMAEVTIKKPIDNLLDPLIDREEDQKVFKYKDLTSFMVNNNGDRAG